MRIPSYSLRVGLLSHLVFLIISAMLLINVVMIKVSERTLIQARMKQGRLLMHALEQHMSHAISSGKRDIGEWDSDPEFKKKVLHLLTSGEFSAVVFSSRKGNLFFSLNSNQKESQACLSLARETLETGVGSAEFSGRTWAVFWLSHETLRLSSPLRLDDRTPGAVAVSSSLIPLYQTLRGSEKMILLYILLDTLILALVGIYLLSRLVIRPINKLLQMTEAYPEHDHIPPAGEESRNEIGNLSRSLTSMLKRLDENKRSLNAHIESLERANRELRQARHEVIRSEKLASVGQLAAGIAHEIGNPIGIILGYLELIRRGDITQEERTDFLSRVETEITRINQIIRSLLDFSRPSTGIMIETGVHGIIQSTVEMLRPQPMMEGVSIRFQLDASRDTVLADPNQLQQVFLNIMMNAAEGMREMTLTLDTPKKKDLVLMSRDSDGSIELRFMDNGPGIPETELSHIFDPFFTTKEPGQGTGLGLFVSFQIIENLGGTIQAESPPGKGTVIIITLPRHKGQEEG